MTDHLHEQAGDRLRAIGHRYTPARRRIVDALSAADQPLTVPQLVDADDALAQSSVYRSLGALADAGVVARVVTGDDFARFELAEPLTDHHHHHLECESCGEVIDVTLPEGLDAALHEALAAVAADAGFEAGHHRVDVVGVCRRCRSRQSRSA